MTVASARGTGRAAEREIRWTDAEMCLQVSVEFPAKNEGKAEQIARAIEAEVPINFAFARLDRSAGTVKLVLSNKAGECGCSLLEGSAMPHDDVWLFRRDAAESVASAVQKLAKRTGSLSFQAIWLGPELDQPKEKAVRLPELTQLIRSSQVSQHIKYVCEGAQSNSS